MQLRPGIKVPGLVMYLCHIKNKPPAMQGEGSSLD